jgi:hypothetical protein
MDSVAAKVEAQQTYAVVLHGYDYIQPRPAFARITVNGPKASGPWIYPILKAAGKTDDEMRAMAKDVIDTLNHWLVRLVKPLPNVHLLDTRNTLTIAEPGTNEGIEGLDGRDSRRSGRMDKARGALVEPEAGIAS